MRKNGLVKTGDIELWVYSQGHRELQPPQQRLRELGLPTQRRSLRNFEVSNKYKNYSFEKIWLTAGNESSGKEGELHFYEWRQLGNVGWVRLAVART